MKYERRFSNNSKEFLSLLKEASPEKAIRAITHFSPLLVFWVAPNAKIIDAKDAHFKNPPNGDKSILSHKTNKGHLRGRSALIGNIVYIVIYGDLQDDLSRYQYALLRRSYSKILALIINKNKEISQELINTAVFIKETGKEIIV